MIGRAAAAEGDRAFVGILYAEDFDVELPEPDTAAPESKPVLDVTEVVKHAVDAARAEWAQSDHHRSMTALETVASAIGATRDAAEDICSAASRATAEAMLAMLAAYLPDRCRAHGLAEVEALMKHVLPRMQQQPRLVVRVHPALLTTLRTYVSTLEDVAMETIVLTSSPALAPGDAQVSWTGGSLRRSTEDIRLAVDAVLTDMRLHDGGLSEPWVSQAAPPSQHHAPPAVTSTVKAEFASRYLNRSHALVEPD